MPQFTCEGCDSEKSVRGEDNKSFAIPEMVVEVSEMKVFVTGMGILGRRKQSANNYRTTTDFKTKPKVLIAYCIQLQFIYLFCDLTEFFFRNPNRWFDCYFVMKNNFKKNKIQGQEKAGKRERANF